MQPDGATYAPKLTKDSGRLDWALDAAHLDRVVRAMVPWPGAWTTLDNEALKIIEAQPEPGPGSPPPPGTVLDHCLLVACGTGALRLLRVQRPGRAPMPAGAMLRGRPIPPGTQLR